MTLAELLADDKLSKFIELLKPILPALSRLTKDALAIFWMYFKDGKPVAMGKAYKLAMSTITSGSELTAIMEAKRQKVLEKARQMFKDKEAIRDALFKAIIGLVLGGII